MCLIIISHKASEKYKLAIAGNRDEFYDRPTSSANYWEDHPSLLAGRDLSAGGTWMGITTSGKVAMITNYRDLNNLKEKAPSRGHLVSNFLLNGDSGKEYLAAIPEGGSKFNGYNLVIGTPENLFYQSNYATGVKELKSGLYGLSNHLLDTPWPKVERAKQKISEILAQPHNEEDIFSALYDELRFEDSDLPNTGVGLEMERMLSSMFIKSPKYGSRTTTFITVDWNDLVRFHERTYDIEDFSYTQNSFEFQLDN